MKNVRSICEFYCFQFVWFGSLLILSSGKKSWKWNERIPLEISIWDLTRTIYNNCRPTVLSEVNSKQPKYPWWIASCTFSHVGVSLGSFCGNYKHCVIYLSIAVQTWPLSFICVCCWLPLSEWVRTLPLQVRLYLLSIQYNVLPGVFDFMHIFSWAIYLRWNFFCIGTRMFWRYIH